ncbi:MAG: (Fe-S)-binding protein, partial [Promethearchaeota archaeon]
MSDDTEKEEIKNVITTGPTVAGLVAPSRANLIEPKTKKKDEQSFENCTHCGYCRHVCRVYNNTWCETDYAGGRNRIIKALDRNDIKFDKEEVIPSVYRCMLCGNCKVVCPVGIDTLAVFQDLRKNVIRRGAVPKKLEIIKNSVQQNNNPYLEQHENRFGWCDSCEEGEEALQRAKIVAEAIASGDLKSIEGQIPKVGYFVGCTSSYRNQELVTATSQVLAKLGVEFTLFPDEKCCGSVLFRTGLEDEAIELVKHNYAMIRKTGVKEVIFSCSG